MQSRFSPGFFTEEQKLICHSSKHSSSLKIMTEKIPPSHHCFLCNSSQSWRFRFRLGSLCGTSLLRSQSLSKWQNSAQLHGQEASNASEVWHLDQPPEISERRQISSLKQPRIQLQFYLFPGRLTVRLLGILFIYLPGHLVATGKLGYSVQPEADFLWNWGNLRFKASSKTLSLIFWF